MLAGFLLIIGGGLIAVGVHQDWVVTAPPTGPDQTLNVMGTLYGSCMLVLAGIIIVIGLFRIARGYDKDDGLHSMASFAALSAVLATIVRTLMFLHDKGLRLGSAATYENLDVHMGLYLLAGGFVVSLLAKMA